MLNFRPVLAETLVAIVPNERPSLPLQWEQHFTFEIDIPIFHENLNISLDVCTFVIQLEL
jgi:hypothetical protein